MANRRRTLVTIGVALALILLASWLAFDQPLLRARSTNLPPSISPPDGHGSGAAQGGLAGAGSSGMAHMMSEPAHRNSLHRGWDAGVPSHSQGSHASNAANAEENGKGRSSAGGETTGTGGSGPGSGGATRAPAASATHAGGPGQPPDVSTLSEASPSAVGTPPRFDASGWTRPAPQSGSAASNGPANEPPLSAGQSGPAGGTIGPLTRADSPGSGSGTGPDSPEGWGRGTSGPAAGSGVSPSPIPVPVPPSLLLFGASALLLWIVSRG
jgi:hypothetical protein